jgi:hypothetical protein
MTGGVHVDLLDFCAEKFQGIIPFPPFLYSPNWPNFNTSHGTGEKLAFLRAENIV